MTSFIALKTSKRAISPSHDNGLFQSRSVTKEESRFFDTNAGAKIFYSVAWRNNWYASEIAVGYVIHIMHTLWKNTIFRGTRRASNHVRAVTHMVFAGDPERP